MARSRKFPRRRHPRLQGYDYTRGTYYFVTLMSARRKRIFGRLTAEGVQLSAAGSMLQQCLHAIPQRFPGTLLDTYIIMPDHVHALLLLNCWAVPELDGTVPSLSRIMGWLKGTVASQINVLRRARGTPVWQTSFYDHIVRTEKALEPIREYIRDNPARAWVKRTTVQGFESHSAS